MKKGDLIKINDWTWEIPKSFNGGMNVLARIYSDESLVEGILRDKSLEQLVNVASLPGIRGYALAMPDMHEGYGFPIGGVAAFGLEDGIISPGGVGFDINCGVRLLRSDVSKKDIAAKLADLVERIYRDVPSGVGHGGKTVLGHSAMKQVLETGVDYLLRQGFAGPKDKINCEEGGSMPGADESLVSERAKKRGDDQLGTLGSGNHFLKVQYVDEIFDRETAEVFGLEKDRVTLMIHCGSRGLGHQVCSDYVKVFLAELMRRKTRLRDRELAYAPVNSLLGKKYFSAMSASANFAWANRQMITHLVRGSWKKILGADSGDLELIYDVAHNIAKIEEHVRTENGVKIREKLCVHRKGATRSFGPGRPELPAEYRKTGQPVLIPGSMGSASYVLAGTDKAMEYSFGSTCHGAGRIMSRHEALRHVRGDELKGKLEKRGIAVRSGSLRGLAEEAPAAYKDIEMVVGTVNRVGLAKRVARLKPLGVVKG